MKNIICIIPARSGSKRIPKKNIKKLLNKPLISWTIETASRVNFQHLVVSTDDISIAEVAVRNGAEVPFIRAPEYATDTASVVDVVLEMLFFYENNGECFDAVMLLQPTSPFRSVESITDAIALFNKSDGESVVSVNTATTHPYWCKKVENGIIKPFVNSRNDSMLRSQDLPMAYQLNGLIYLASVHTLKHNKDFYSSNTKALIIDSEEECIDIDTPFDWMIAEIVAEKRV